MPATTTTTTGGRPRYEDVCADLTRDLLCQLRRHAVENFGQASHGHNLLGPIDSAVRRDITRAVEAAKARWAADHGGRPRTGDDLVADWKQLRALPLWMRRLLHVPRCTSTMSMYVYMLLDVVVWLAVTKVMRYVMEEHYPDRGTERQRWWFLMLFSAVAGGLLCSLLFVAVHRHWDFLDEPHFVLTAVVAGYTVLCAEIDGLVPNVPVTRQRRPEAVDAAQTRSLLN